MDGIHDMGGMDGFGSIPIESDEPIFHATWEGRVYAINTAIGVWGKWNIDAGRYGIEVLDPALYLRSSYYERWLYRNENLMVEHDLITQDELDSGKASGGDRGTPPDAEEIFEKQRKSRSFRVDADIAPKFAPGDTITVRNIHPKTHTRIPRYVRSKRGVIDRDHGVFIFPDTNAQFQGKKPQRVYSVMFPAQELWGPDAPEQDKIYLDLWDDYMDPA